MCVDIINVSSVVPCNVLLHCSSSSGGSGGGNATQRRPAGRRGIATATAHHESSATITRPAKNRCTTTPRGFESMWESFPTHSGCTRAEIRPR